MGDSKMADNKVDVQALITKVLSDDQFAQQLVNDPQSTLMANGIEPSAQIMSALTGIDLASIRRLAKAFGGDKAAV
jgi:hypothetical protein